MSHPGKRSWGELMQKLDGDSLAPKPKAVRKVNGGKPVTTPITAKPTWPPPVPEGCFDVYKHGYYLRNGALIFKMPDGTSAPATGVDSFGPFREAPRQPFYFKK